MSKSLKKISVVAVALATSLGVVQTAKADVLATAVIQLNNLQFKHAVGGATLDKTTDFSMLNYSNTAATFASFTGTANQSGSGTGTPLDLPLICNGPGCAGSGLTPNGFQSLGTVTGRFAAADQLEKGFPITGIATGTPPPPPGATVSSAAYGQIKAPATSFGSANSNNGLTASIKFKTTFSGAVEIDADYSFFWKALLSAGEGAGSFTHTSGVVDFNLVDVTDPLHPVSVFDFKPVPLNWDVSLNGPAPVDISFSNSMTGSFTSGPIPVLSTQTYQLTAREITIAEVKSAVPEPGTLALFGLGLLGLGLARRRLSVN